MSAIPQSAIRNRQSEQGVALVITLILLAVTLVMAIAFLAISRRERFSVSGTEDAAAAKYAMNAAQHNAEARIATQILITTNPYVFTLLVSTNYANSLGFVPGSVNPTNVNYNYYAPNPYGPGGNNPLSAADREQNIANLYYNPRPPVYYGSNDFRFYLDLNRNGMYDTNGWVTNVDNTGNGLGTMSLEVGDPEWIGVLAHPDQPHGPNNPFIARYCYIAVPANSLDLNYIHNQASAAAVDPQRAVPLSINNDSYYRNQGVGNWELNLAAFLTDLNTNIWDPQPFNGYQYTAAPENRPNQGLAFKDAFVLLTNRLAGYQSQHSVQNLFGANGDTAFQINGIDGYLVGGLQTTFDTNYSPQLAYALPWMGAENTNNFFTPDDLFNANKMAGFAFRLQDAGTNIADAEGNKGNTVSTYDRYTFYRMMAQMGTETKPALGKINLNYTNAIVNYDPNFYGVATDIAIVPNLETNFGRWNPQDFFTVAANQMLKAYTAEWFEASPSNYMQNYYGYYGNNILAPVSGFISYTNLDGMNVTNYGLINQVPSFGLTNIPVVVNGSFVYSPAINRVLQLAANIYDATTNTSTLIDSNYPSVFRPIFFKASEYNAFLGRSFTNVYIRGYQYVPDLNNTPGLAGAVLAPPMELTDLPFGYSVSNVWGVPMIIGAKKGFPNFNGFELVSTVFIERQLQFTRTDVTPQPQQSYNPTERNYATNQQYVVGITNVFAMADWNSYVNAYNNQVTIYGQDQLAIGLTNSDNLAVQNTFFTNVWNASTLTLGLPIQPWPGNLSALPFGTNVAVMHNLGYYPSPPSTNNLYTYYVTPRPVTLPGPSGSVTYMGPCFIPNSMDPQNYLDTKIGTPPLPQFGMLETNHLQAYMLDTDQRGNVHILDYVQLGSMNDNLDINAAIDDPPDGSGLWSTNTYLGSTTPWGVVNQYKVSTGNGTVPTEDRDGASAGGTGGGWSVTPVPGLPNSVNTTPGAQQAYCAAFFSAGDSAPYGSGWVTNTLYSMQAPFTPMRQIVQRYVLQANDPLVHYLSSDLTDLHDDTTNRAPIKPGGPNPTTIQDVNGQPSDRYLPWGDLQPGAQSGTPPSSVGLAPTLLWIGNPPEPVKADQNPYNFGYKDPLVWSSDNWDFPTNKFPTVGWLGRVHRGTPWQSVYLKSTNIWRLANGPVGGSATWQVWSGDLNSDDAFNESPAQDRLLFDLFTATPDDDAMRGQVSVNIGADDPTNELAGLASWSALLSGTVAFTSITNENDLQLGFQPGYQDPISGAPWYQRAPYFNVITNQPLGALAYPPWNSSGVVSITNAALWQIVHGINSTRTNFTAIDHIHGAFEHVGDILATPQLSDGSPFLETGDPAQLNSAMSDEMYEWLPQQMLGLMTVSGTQQSPPRYVIYCYGQALKPAQNGIVTSGSFQGMCTNYQVVAESASRVVIRVDNPPNPANPTATPHIVVEQFNTLPPN